MYSDGVWSGSIRISEVLLYYGKLTKNSYQMVCSADFWINLILHFSPPI